MADSTINYGFPYPTGGDAVAVHSDIEKIAKAVDARVASIDGAPEVTYVGDGVYEIG